MSNNLISHSFSTYKMYFIIQIRWWKMLELLRKRRSIRKYQDKSIDSTIIEDLKETLLRSPTSRNRKAWKFWFITDKKLLEKLSFAKASGSAMIKDAPLAVVIGADSSQTDVWIEDCSIASILLQMVAEEKNLGSVWVQIRNRFNKENMSSENIVKEILNSNNADIKIESIIAIGYKAEEKPPIDKNELNYNAIIEM